MVNEAVETEWLHVAEIVARSKFSDTTVLKYAVKEKWQHEYRGKESWYKVPVDSEVYKKARGVPTYQSIANPITNSVGIDNERLDKLLEQNERVLEELTKKKAEADRLKFDNESLNNQLGNAHTALQKYRDYEETIQQLTNTIQQLTNRLEKLEKRPWWRLWK